MKTKLLFLEDVTKLEFEANVLNNIKISDGRFGAILDQTCFYPTGGGQEHDLGMLGDVNILDVIKDESTLNPVILHISDKEIPLGPIVGKIDYARRLRHMQHHTAQHLLSQCFVKVFGIESVSSNINGYTPSTLDIASSKINRNQCDQIEDLANQIIYKNWIVKTYFVSPKQLTNLPLRKHPKVQEDIRIVEIDGYDFTPCGGTHCTHTGQIGTVKILKVERQGELSRIYFVAGEQAFQYFREYQNTVQTIANQLSTHPQDILINIQNMIEQGKTLQREVQVLRQERIGIEAKDLVEKAQVINGIRVVVSSFEKRSIFELRTLADKLKIMPMVIAILASYEEPKISIVVTSADNAGFQARDLLARLLASIGGRGGGDRQIAQGGGTITREQFNEFDALSMSVLKKLIQP